MGSGFGRIRSSLISVNMPLYFNPDELKEGHSSVSSEYSYWVK